MAKRLSTYSTESVSEYTRKKKKDDLGIIQTKSSLDIMDENNIQDNINRVTKQNETLLKQLQDAGISEKQIEKVDDNRNFIQKFLNLKENQGLITGTLELLNRPAEALQGALASSRTGENVLDAMWNGLYGVKDYTLDDALGIKFDDPFVNGLANLAFEVAVDPFNYMNQPFKFAKTKALDIAKQAWGKLEVVATRSKQGKELFDAANGALTQVIDSFKKTFGTWGDKRVKSYLNSVANDKHIATSATQSMQKHLFDLNDNIVNFSGELKTQLKTMSTSEKEDIFKFLELEKDFDKKLFNVDSSVSEKALDDMTNAIKRQLTRTIESNMKHGYSLDTIFKNIINDEQYAFLDFTGGKDIKAFKETNEAYKQLRDIVKYYGGDDVNVDDILKIENIIRGKQGVGGILKDGMDISLMHVSDVGIGVKFNKDYYNKETLKNIRQGMRKISKARDEYILKRWSLRDKNFTQFDSIVNDLLTKGKVVVSDISSEQMDVVESFMKVYESITNNKLELMKSTTLNSRQVEYTFAPSKSIMNDYKRIEHQLANNDKVLDKINNKLAPYYNKIAKRNDLSNKMDILREMFINDFTLHTNYYFNTLVSNTKNYQAFDSLITNDVIKPYNTIIDKYNKKDFFIQPTSMVDDATYRNVDTGFRNFINLFKHNNDLAKQLGDLGVKFIIDDNTLTNGCKVAFPIEIDFDKVLDYLSINISKDESIFNFVAYLMHKNIISHNDLVANGISSLKDLYKLDMNKLKEIIPNRLNISIANNPELVQGDFLVINEWLNDDIIIGAGDIGNLLDEALTNIFNGNLTPLDVYENLYTQLNNETIINFFATKGKAQGAFGKNIHVRNQLEFIDEYLNLKKDVNAINREITNFTKKNNVTQLEVLRDVYTKGVYNYSLETRVGKFINDLKLKGGYDLNNFDNELVSLIDDLSLQYNKSTEIINGYWNKVYDIQQHIINKYNKQILEIGWDLGAYKRFKGSDINLFRNTTKDIYVTPLDKLGDVAFSLEKPNNGLPYFVLKNADAKRIVEADNFIEKINDINANKADLMYQKEEATIALEFNRGEFLYNHDNLLQRKNELASLSANEMSAELIYKNFYHNKALDEVKDATTKNIDSAKKEIKFIDKEIKTKEKEIIKDQAQRQLDANNKIKEIDKEIEIKQKEIDTIKNQPTQEVVEDGLDNILKENFSQFELDDIKDSYDFYKERLNAYDKLNEDVLKTQWFDDDYISISDIVTDGEAEFLDTLTKIIENEDYQHLLNMDKDDTKILKRLRDKVDRRIDKYNEGFDYDYQENKFYENLEEIQDEWDEFDFKTKTEELNNVKKYDDILTNYKPTTPVAQDTTKIDTIQKEIDDLLKQKDELSKPIEPNEDLVYELDGLKENKKLLDNVLTKEKDKLTKLEETNINNMPSTEVSNMTDELTINATNDAYVPTTPLVEADLYYKNTQYLQPLFDELKFVRDVLNPNILETSVSDVQTMLSKLPQMFEQNMNRLANVQMSIQGEIGRLFESIYGVSMDGWNVQGYMRHIWSPDAAMLNTIINQVEGKVSGMVGATLMGKNMKKLALHREYQGSAYDINKAFGTELFNENAIEITALALEMLPQTFSIGGAFKNMFDMGVIKKVDWLDLNKQGLDEAYNLIKKQMDTILKDKKQTSFQKLELQNYQEMLDKIDEFKALKKSQFNEKVYNANKTNDELLDEISNLEKELVQKRKQLNDAKINQPENVYKQLEKEVKELNETIKTKRQSIKQPTLTSQELIDDLAIREKLNTLSSDINSYITKSFMNDKWLQSAYSQDSLVKNFGKEYQWVDTKLLETIKNNFEGFQKAIGDGLPKAFSETTWVKEIDNMIKDIEHKGGKYIVHKGVMEQLRRYSFQMKSNDVGTLFRMLQKYITVPFKKLSLLSVGFHVRNWFTNISNAWLAGINVSDFHHGMTIANKELKMFEECIKDIDNALLSGNYVSAEDQIKLINKLKSEGGEKWRVFDDYLEMSSRGVIGNNQFKSDHVEMLNKIKNSALGIKGSFDFKTSKKWINTPKEGMKKLMEQSFLLSKHMDDFGKISIYRLVRDNDKYLKLGKEMGFEATAKTKKMLDDGFISMEEFLKLEREDIAEQYTKFILFDYNNLTFREETYMKALFPFYTWMRKNLEFQLKNFAHNNPRYLKMFNALQGWRNGIVGDENNEQDYHENYIPIWNEDGKITYIKFNPSYDEVDRFLDGSAIVNGLTPIIKTPLEMVTGYDFFTRRQFNTNGVIPGFGLGLNNILGTFDVIQNMIFKNYTPTYEDKKLAGVIGKKLIDVVQVTKNLFSFGKDARDDGLINSVASLFPSVFSQNDIAMSQYYNAKERQKQLQEAIKKYLG